MLHSFPSQKELVRPQEEVGGGHFEEQEAKPQLSERLKHAAAHVGEQVQDTVSSAWNHAKPNWQTVPALVFAVSRFLLHAVSGGMMKLMLTTGCLQLAGLLLLSILTSWLTSRFSQPDLTKRQLSAIITSVEQADRRYNALVKALDSAQGQVHTTEDRFVGKTALKFFRCMLQELWGYLSSFVQRRCAGCSPPKTS